MPILFKFFIIILLHHHLALAKNVLPIFGLRSRSSHNTQSSANLFFSSRRDGFFIVSRSSFWYTIYFISHHSTHNSHQLVTSLSNFIHKMTNFGHCSGFLWQITSSCKKSIDDGSDCFKLFSFASKLFKVLRALLFVLYICFKT